jgi:hypothetical protein
MRLHGLSLDAPGLIEIEGSFQACVVAAHDVHIVHDHSRGGPSAVLGAGSVAEPSMRLEEDGGLCWLLRSET